jgi:hypothetical protein
MTYKLLNSIPFTELNSNDIYALTICNEVAKQSEFINAQKRLGAYLNYGKNRYNFYGENYYRERVGKIMMKSTHAEMNAIMKFLKSRYIYKLTHVLSNKKRKRKYNLKNSILYVLRTLGDKTNDFVGNACGLSKPCKICQKYLALHGVGTIKYTEYVNGINVLHTMKLINYT